MKRLIDANALKKEAWPERYTGEGIIYVEDVDKAPTVDAVEVVHGRTEVIEPVEVTLTTRCCLCGVAMGNLDNYCPNCGAKMDGDGNG